MGRRSASVREPVTPDVSPDREKYGEHFHGKRSADVERKPFAYSFSGVRAYRFTDNFKMK